MSTPRQTLALIGLRCSGKSSVGERLAKTLGLPFTDLDERVREFASNVEATEFHHTGEVLAMIGASRFRALESLALAMALDRKVPFVLATGGGVVELAENRSRLASSSLVIWLDAPLDVLSARLRADPALRPPVLGRDPVEELAALHARRAAWYAEVANLRIDSGADSPDVIAARLSEHPRVKEWLLAASAA
ncbi:MAG: shikimate kinase [Planctomycetes bacterium]|nr:shikimate kinase [Planctomycetota bacterium]